MSVIRGREMGDLGAEDENGAAGEEGSGIRGSDPSRISKDYWVVAEEAAQEVVNCIHPTLDSEEKRKDVIDYVQKILKCSLGFEAFAFGSVPLKTYLPDGDIDLTAVNDPFLEELWAGQVLSVLQREEQNDSAEYEVRDTQFIDAEVKLVKCIVENIVIDISFNQLGGISTLCFLEQADRFVGKNHLFKRSILLIKAWCYYESRILGAYHGLLSTYALETLVLYIFQLFHSSLDGPFEVLYKFLDYFSIFNWDNYCISVSGPVCKSSLPDIVVELPDNHVNSLMLNEEFLQNCVELFTVPYADSGSNSRVFAPKHLNIIDPLKEYNNLGRSVHRGNFYRIRSAFKYGARKLGRIMSLPIEEIADEIKKFFSNTLQRHLYKNGSDAELYSPFSLEGSQTLYSMLSSEGSFSQDDSLRRSNTGDFENEGLEIEEKCSSVESGRSLRQNSSQVTSEHYSMNGSAFSGICSNGNSYDHAACNLLDVRGINGGDDSSSTDNLGNEFSRQQYHYPPEFYLYDPSAENGHFCQTRQSDGIEGNPELHQWLESGESHAYMVDTYQSCADYLESNCSCSSIVSSPKTSILESSSIYFRERDTASIVDTEPLNPLADLTGDYDSHLRSLSYWRCWHGLGFCAPLVSPTSALPFQYPRKKVWDPIHQSIPNMPSSYAVMNSNGVFMEPPASFSIQSSASASNGDCKARGMDTCLPSMHYYPPKERPLQGRRTKKTAPESLVLMQKDSRSNGNYPCYDDTGSWGRSSPREALNAHIPFQARKKSGFISQRSKEGDTRAKGSHSKEQDTRANGTHFKEGNARVNGTHSKEGHARVNGSHSKEGNARVNGSHSKEGAACVNGSHSKEGAARVNGSHSMEGDACANGSFSGSCTIEFGSLGPLADEVISNPSCSNGLIAPVALQDKGNPTSGLKTKKERDADCSFHLKNDEEFPALSI